MFKTLEELVNTIRQRNWMTNRVDEILDYTNYKRNKTGNKRSGYKNFNLKKTIKQVVKELKETEPVVNDYAIPTNYTLKEQLLNGRKFSKFRYGVFPSAEDYMKDIGADTWFLKNETNSGYGVNRDFGRVMFGKDIYNKSEYYVYFRVLETNDEYFDYYRKRHAFWKMYGMNLPDSVLKKLYYENALKLFPTISKDLFK